MLSDSVCLGGRTARKIQSMTSWAERQNLSMRMGMRRFTRLSNAFSKKVENLAHAVSLHYMYYNFARPHQRSPKTTATKRPPPRWPQVSPTASGQPARSPNSTDGAKRVGRPGPTLIHRSPGRFHVGSLTRRRLRGRSIHQVSGTVLPIRSEE